MIPTDDRIEQIAELAVRRYFDHYLSVVVPAQARTAREHTHLMVEKHNTDPAAHGAVERKVARFFWVTIGLALSGGLGAGTLIAAIVRAAAGNP